MNERNNESLTLDAIKYFAPMSNVPSLARNDSVSSAICFRSEASSHTKGSICLAYVSSENVLMNCIICDRVIDDIFLQEGSRAEGLLRFFANVNMYCMICCT